MCGSWADIDVGVTQGVSIFPARLAPLRYTRYMPGIGTGERVLRFGHGVGMGWGGG